MKLPPMPPSVKVGPYTFTVHRIAPMPKIDGKKTNGYIDPDKLRIYIYKRAKRAKAKEWLWHELKHSVVNPQIDTSKWQEEEWVSYQAPLEVQILHDNPELVAYLVS